MKETSLPIWLMCLYLLLSLALPVYIGYEMRLKSEVDVLKGDEPNYLRHKLPKKKTAEVEKQLPYKLEDIQRGNMVVPRVFLSTLPKSLPDEPNVKAKKALFIKTMLPLILRANELILEDRKKLVAVDRKMEQGQKLSAAEERWIRPLLKRYRVLKKGALITHIHIEQLTEKMNIIPPSLALAQAAIESGWGTSYFAQHHQALYGQWTWNPKAKGVVPANRPKGMTHRIKAFDYLLESVISYMTNLNRHEAYKKLRDRRSELISLNLPLTGHSLAHTLDRYSEKGHDYVTDLLNIIAYNKFSQYDFAALAPPKPKVKIAQQ